MPQLDYENRDSLQQRQARSARQDTAGRIFAGLFGAALFIMGLIAVATQTFNGKRAHLTGGKAIAVGVGYMLIAMLPAYITFHGRERQSGWIWPAVASFLMGVLAIVLATKVKW